MSPELDAVAEAYLWGLPLVTMHRTCAAHGGVGRGMLARDRLATAADRTVVAPNNDTLYASGWFDLRDGDLVVDVGAMDTPARYWSVMLLDAYTDVTYICRRLHGSAGTRVHVTYDPAATPPPPDLPVRPPDGPADAVAGPPGPPPVIPTAVAGPSSPEGTLADDPGNAGPPGAGQVSSPDGVLAGGPGDAVVAGGGRVSSREVVVLADGHGRVRSPDGALTGGPGNAGGPEGGRVSSQGDVLAGGGGGAVVGGGGRVSSREVVVLADGHDRVSSPDGALAGGDGNAGGPGGGRVSSQGGVHVDGPRDAGAPGVGGSAGRAQVGVGTPTVWVLARVLVAGPDDLGAARDALAAIRVEQVAGGRAGRGGEAVAAGAGEGGGFLEELRAALAVDPPGAKHPAPPEGLDELLRTPPAPDVVAAGLERGKAIVARSGGVDRRGNGWGTRSRGARFGDDVAYRAAFARVSLAGHLPAENRSYTRPFDGSTPARLRFPPGGEPPVDGFWSLCVYGPDLFLVDNAIDRYSVGDRTPGLRRDPDGGLTITIGADRTAGSVAGAGNWLPAPAGPCFLSLRAYEGRADVVDATWFPPDLEPLS